MAIPVSLDDAKIQLRVELDDAERDDEIRGFIDDAAAWIEEWTGHILEARDVTAEFSALDRMTFREYPIASDAVPTVTYEGADGQAWPVTTVRMNVSARPARVVSWVGYRFPAIPVGAPITVTVRAGYEDADTVPGVFRRVMLMLIGAYDDDREGGATLEKAEKTARRLCNGLRIRRL
ncbi:phage head-tail connector protein [Sphingobium sp. WCS2017Hpa-17]|uniref:phage head-tail connector protein n=1 Tax=Sphingobium sp. WCS2017Hpa-17 TaxID=3073638 RepID=UPI00288ACBBB|nr:phage head-tail connector protein [Sphingobium sp. WCS2017Hpa-17]